MWHFEKYIKVNCFISKENFDRVNIQKSSGTENVPFAICLELCWPLGCKILLICGQSKDTRRLTNDVQTNYDYASLNCFLQQCHLNHFLLISIEQIICLSLTNVEPNIPSTPLPLLASGETTWGFLSKTRCFYRESDLKCEM